MQAIDLCIIGSFIVYSITSGLLGAKKASRDLNEYFLAGRSLKGWQSGMSMAATQFAADTPLLVTGLIATAGIFSLWRMWIYALAFLMMGFLLGPSWRKAGVLTDAEFTELRYGDRPAAILRGVKAIYSGLILNCVGLAIVLLAATRIAEPFLLWNIWLPSDVFDPVLQVVKMVGVPFTVNAGGDLWIRSANNLISILAIALCTAFYSTTGGLRSVVATDVVQLVLGLTGSAIYAWVVVSMAGGLGELPHKLGEQLSGTIDPNQLLDFTPSHAKDVSLSLLSVLAIQWLAQTGADGSGYLAQRTMACQSDRDAKMAAVVFTVTQILLRSLLWIPIGLSLLVVFPPDPQLAGDVAKAARESTFVRGISELLPPGGKGLMLVGMLAALASTVDTHLNWGSSYLTNDIFKRFICQGLLKKEPTPRAQVWVARLSNLVILSTSLVVMSKLSSIQSAWQDSLLLGAGIGICLVLRWIWWRINVWGEISGLVLSIVLVPMLLTVVPHQMETLRIIILFFTSTVLCVLVSLLTGPEAMDKLKSFYLRAEPPGVWGPVARAAGCDEAAPLQRFVRASAATFLSALSIFCILVGTGSALFHSPPPAFIPNSALWSVLVLGTGALLVPIWWKLGFEADTGANPPAEDA